MTHTETQVTEIARRFSILLYKEIGFAKLVKVNELNEVEASDGVCHSHDFCDANMPMFEAFVAAIGREPDVGSDADAAMINAAWDYARINRFDIHLHCKPKIITMHVVWNEDGDAVGYTCEKTAELRLLEDYGGSIVGSRTITMTVEIDKPIAATE